MRKREPWGYARLMLLCVVIIGSGASTAAAETSSSANYQVTESEFSAMSNKLNCSASYCAKASIGDMGAPVSKSPTSKAQFGPVTESDPLLEVIIDPGQSNLGELTTERTAFKTTTVRVRTYLSNGYTLQILGDPPKYNGHILSAPTTPTPSQMGTEQFGVNATVNTTPNVGMDLVQIPSSLTSFGVVNDNYKIPNKFMYVSGSEVSHSESESGRTDYTISMIVNVSNSTPAGHYSGDFSAIVIPIY